MKILAILFGVVLAVLGVVNFNIVGGTGFLVLLGLLAVIFGSLQGRWPHHFPLFGTIMMAILAIINTVRGVLNLVGLLGGLPQQAVWVQSIIAGVSLLYVILEIILIPDFWHGWKAFGQFLADWVARVALTIFYFTILIPFGLGVSLFADPLNIKKKDSPLWQARTTGDRNLKEVLRQY